MGTVPADPERQPESPPGGGSGGSASFLRDMAKYLPAQVVPGIIGVVSIPVITRLFTPVEYGNYSVALATIAFATALLGWIPASIIRFHPAAEQKQALPLFLGTVQGLALLSVACACLLTALGLITLGHALSPDLRRLLWIGVGALAADSLFLTYQHILRARLRVGWYSLYAALKSACSLGLGLLLAVALDLGVAGLLWGVAIATLALLPLTWHRALEGGPTPTRRIDTGLTAEMAKYSVPLVLGNVAAWVLSLSDRYVIEFSRGAHEVGIYSVSYDIGSRSTMLMVTLFMLASGPLSMRIWESQGAEHTRVFCTNVTRYFLLVGVLMVTGMIALSRPLMRVMAGGSSSRGTASSGMWASGCCCSACSRRSRRGCSCTRRRC